MAADIFAKIGDIKGESTDDKHKDEMEVLSWSWGVSRPPPPNAGPGTPAGKPSFNDFVLLHRIDKASPVLLKACATGEHIKDAMITSRRAGGKAQHEYLIIKMSDVIITGVAPSGTGDSNIENVSLVFSKLAYEYRPQKPDGTADASVFFKFDIKSSKVG